MQRKQNVKIGDKLSEESVAEIVVTQGTVLGPVLFLVNVNSISGIKNNKRKLVSSADDTALIITRKSGQGIQLES